MAVADCGLCDDDGLPRQPRLRPTSTTRPPVPAAAPRPAKSFDANQNETGCGVRCDSPAQRHRHRLPGDHRRRPGAQCVAPSRTGRSDVFDLWYEANDTPQLLWAVRVRHRPSDAVGPLDTPRLAGSSAPSSHRATTSGMSTSDPSMARAIPAMSPKYSPAQPEGPKPTEPLVSCARRQHPNTLGRLPPRGTRCYATQTATASRQVAPRNGGHRHPPGPR